MESIKSHIKSFTLFDEENTIEVRYNEGVHIELNHMIEIFNQMYEYTGNKRLKRLIIISKDTTISKEARKYLQDQNHAKKDTIIAEAVVVSSLAQKMAINFYLGFIKDDFPSRFFNDVNKAKEWLKAQSN